MPTSGIQFGAYVDNRAAVFLPNYPLSKVLEAAAICEELGYHSVWVGESWLAKPRYEPITTLAAIAMRTKTTKLGTSILQPQHRNPVHLALTWAALDVLASGRTILGVGVGAGPPSEVEKEHAVSGVPKRQRGKVFEECIEIVKKLWTQDNVNYSGSYFSLNGISLGYRPVQKPHPPIWIAAGIYVAEKPNIGPAADHWHAEHAGGYRHGPFARVARLGDGWWGGFGSPSQYAESWRTIQALAGAAGRDPAQIHPALVCWINIDQDRARAREEGKLVLEKYHNMPMDSGTLERSCFGTPQDCVRWIEAYMAAGARTIMLVFRSFDPLGQMKKFARELLPSF